MAHVLMEYYLSIKNASFFICKNIHETGNNCVKWNKLCTEGQMLHNFTNMYNTKKLAA